MWGSGLPPELGGAAGRAPLSPSPSKDSYKHTKRKETLTLEKTPNADACVLGGGPGPAAGSAPPAPPASGHGAPPGA